MVAPHEGNGSVAAEADAAQRAWQPDLRYIKLGTGTYYLLVFLDAFGRFVTYWGLLRWVDGETVSLSALSALETVPRAERAQIQIQRNNGSAFVSADFARILRENRVTHARIHPQSPEQNGFGERVLKTIGEPPPVFWTRGRRNHAALRVSS